MRHERANAWWSELLPRVRLAALLCGLLGACAEAPLANGSVDREVRDELDDEEQSYQGEDELDDDDVDAVNEGSADEDMASRAGASSFRDASAESDEAEADGRNVSGGLPSAALDASLLPDDAVDLAVDASGIASATALSDASVASGPLCRLAGNQIAVMGDSYLDLSGDISRFIQGTARAAGALDPTDSYIDCARNGASMAYPPSIPSQLPSVRRLAAERASAGVRLVIMDGGGNDVLVHNRECLDMRQPSAACLRVVETSVRTLKQLFADMADAGVEEVIYFWYPDLPGGGLGGSRPHVMNGYAAPRMREACETSADLKCTFIDTRPAFAGHAEYISAVDNTHPTAAGSRVIADLIWDVMVQRCVGSR